jgi:hypothetical protein
MFGVDLPPVVGTDFNSARRSLACRKERLSMPVIDIHAGTIKTLAPIDPKSGLVASRR